VSILTDILDRLSGISALRERVAGMTMQQAEVRRVVLEQQKELASLQGQVKALIRQAAMPPGRR
jgi:hypothetical protein